MAKPIPQEKTRGTVHTMRAEFRGVILFIALIWSVFLLSQFFPGLNNWGLIPRRLIGLIGIGSMTFLHSNLGHIGKNTIPLFVLLMLLAGTRGQTWSIASTIVVLGGSFLWLIGMRNNHIGASLLIFGLITFLIGMGLFEMKPMTVVIAILVGVLYGVPLIRGVLPFFQPSDVSWDGHLCGAVAGACVAWLMGRDLPLVRGTRS